MSLWMVSGGMSERVLGFFGRWAGWRFGRADAGRWKGVVRTNGMGIMTTSETESRASWLESEGDTT